MGKLGPRYYGPYQIMERIGNVAYRLLLPEGTRLHDVFHVELLKKFHGDQPTSPTPPTLPPIEHGRALPMPAKVLKACLRRDVWHVLVQWIGLDASTASWEPLEEFKRSYPSFQLEDELFHETGRDVMWGIPYR